MEAALMIYKSNALVEAAYRLTVQEQRILLACISQVRHDEVVTDEVLYSVRAADLARLSGTAVEAAYSELKAAALRLKRREVRVTQEPNGEGKKPKVMITGWVQTIFYIEGEGRVELRFTKDMLPYLTELTRQFTKYSLADVAKMDSSHAIRLYELLMQWDTKGQREISIEDLRKWLQLEGCYPLMAEFRRWVIEPAVTQINEHSPISVYWTQRKTGRKITHLHFTFGPKQTATPALVDGFTKPKKRAVISKAKAESMARPGESYEALYQRLSSKYIIEN